MDNYHRAAHPNDPRVKSSSSSRRSRSRSRSPRKSRYNRRSRSKSPNRSYNRSRHDSRSKRRDSRERNDRRRVHSPNEHMIPADAPYGNYDGCVDPNYNNAWPHPYPQVYPPEFGYANAPPPPIINTSVEPMPPGSTDFAPPAPMWNPNEMVGGVPPVAPVEDEEARKKKDAAIAEEIRNQRLALEKQRDDCKQRAAALSRELDILRNQRKDLTTSSKRSPSPTTMNFIRENDKLQTAIQEKLSTIKNVIEMLSDIIGKDAINNDEKLIEKPKKESSSKKETSKSRKEEKSPLKSKEKNKQVERNGVFNIVHYDPELHWCQSCNVFPTTAKDYLNHLHSREHQQKQAPEQPWREKVVNDDFPSLPDAPTKRTPIRGLQFFVPATAYFCKLCDFWMGDLYCASVHLKSQKHALEFNKILTKAPNFEIEWATERQRALDMSGGSVNMHTNADEGNTFLDGIPLQLKSTKPDTNHAVQNLMEKVMKNIEPKRKSLEVPSKSTDKKKHKKDDSKDSKKRKRKRKHSSSSSSSSDSSSSSSSDSSSSSSSSSSSDDSDDDDDNKKKKLDPISIVRKLQSEALAKREKEVSTQGGWTSVPQNAIESKRLTRPKSPPKVNIPGPQIIEFTDKTREKKTESSSSSRSHDSRNSRNDSKNRNTSTRRPKSPEKRDKDRAKTTLKIDPSKSIKNAPTPLEKSRETRSRDASNSTKKSESKRESSDDQKKKQLNKKLPFIGRMPVFKKQQAMEKEEQRNKEEAQSYDMDMSNDCDDLMPDPMHYAFLNAPPPPPPPQVYQMPPKSQSYAISHHDDAEEILPPGITQEEHDSVAQPETPAAPPKGPLHKDFQEALNILFEGAKPPSPIPVPEPKEEVEQTYVYDPDAPTILTHEDLSRHSFPEQANFNEIVLPEAVPIPKTNNQKVTPPPAKKENTKPQNTSMDALELEMLGIDASDLAAQSMYK